jgi:hypothetical protein
LTKFFPASLPRRIGQLRGSAEPHAFPLLAPSYLVCGSTSSRHITIPSPFSLKVIDLPLLLNSTYFLSTNPIVRFSISIKPSQSHSVTNCLEPQRCLEAQATRLETQSSTTNTPQHRRVLSNLCPRRAKAYLLHSVRVSSRSRISTRRSSSSKVLAS